MRIYFFATVASLALAMGGSLQAQSGPDAGENDWPPPGVSFHGDPSAPDISGVWMGTAMGIPGKGPISNYGTTADGRPPAYLAPWPLPYTDKYRKMSEERAEATKRGIAIGDIGAKCLPFGFPYIVVSQHYPEEIVQTPGQVTFYFFGTFPITVWTDGRPHPKDLRPSFNGHSIGHWQGDTLHVDTVGTNGLGPLDSSRSPHSDKLRVTWTVRRVTPDILHIVLTMYDEEAFSEPVTLTNITHRKTSHTWAVMDDQSCFENNADVPPPKSAEGFIKF